MALSIENKEIERVKKRIGYKGCRNCQHNIESPRLCAWAEQGGDGRIHFICPRWEKRNATGVLMNA